MTVRIEAIGLAIGAAMLAGLAGASAEHPPAGAAPVVKAREVLASATGPRAAATVSGNDRDEVAPDDRGLSRGPPPLGLAEQPTH